MILKAIKWVWQLPQNILGCFMIAITSAVYTLDFNDLSIPAWYTPQRFTKGWSGISLGKYRLITKYPPKTIPQHEAGHSKQSLLLGPLYLIVIGLPSLVGNLLHRLWKFDYYKQPWEKWADSLGGVQR